MLNVWGWIIFALGFVLITIGWTMMALAYGIADEERAWRVWQWGTYTAALGAGLILGLAIHALRAE